MPKKHAVFALVERGGEAWSFHATNVSAKTLRPVITKHASRKSYLMTDESPVYPKIGGEFSGHGTVNHSASEYVRGTFWYLFDLPSVNHMPKIIKPRFLRGKRVCIFCGDVSKRISKEHIFPLWLKEFFPRDESTTHTSAYISWPENIITKEPIDRRKRNQGHVGSKKLKVVCERCNNEWLSGLEARAKSGLPPLIMGQRSNILPGGQALLATWAAKTAMVAEHFEPREPGTAQSDRAWLMENLTPPPKNWLIWMGAYKGTDWRELGIFQNRGRLSPTPVAKPSDAPYYIQATTFGVGHVLFLVVNSTSSVVHETFGRWEPDGFPQIWPRCERSLLWPPARVLEDPQANAAANILNAPGVFDHSLDPGANWTFTF